MAAALIQFSKNACLHWDDPFEGLRAGVSLGSIADLALITRDGER